MHIQLPLHNMCFLCTATSFLELWKRKQSVIIWEWDLQNIESDEENRPEFEASVKTFRTNPVTKEREPYMPTWSRAVRYALTASVVLFMVRYYKFRNTETAFARLMQTLDAIHRFVLFWPLCSAP